MKAAHLLTPELESGLKTSLFLFSLFARDISLCSNWLFGFMSVTVILENLQYFTQNCFLIMWIEM